MPEILCFGDFCNWLYGFISLSFLDVVLLLCSGLAALAVMAAYLAATKRREE